MEKFDVDYDAESDDLFIYAREKSKGSIELGDLILDFDRKGELVGIEMLNASKFIADCVDDKFKISKKFLSDLLKCSVTVKQKNNFLFIRIDLIGKDVVIPCPINAPIVTEASPAISS